MSAPVFDLDRLPPRMTTSEVVAVARISRQTLARRMANGSLDLQPIDRGRELLFRKADVIRAFGLGESPPAPLIPAPSWDGPVRIDADAIRAAIAAQRRERRPPPKPAPAAAPKMSPAEHRGLLLNLRRGIRVTPERDGRYAVHFVTRANGRASTWPPVITLPRAQPGTVDLSDEAKFRALIAEADAIYAECRAALVAEKGQEGPKTAR